MSTAAAMRAYQGPALFSFGFRPFFLAGAVWAAIAAPLWAWMFFGAGGLTPARPALDWHIHEMLFGYVAAIIAGFLLTAVPNWTGRYPVVGWRLAVLFALWVAGRAAMIAPVGSVWTVILDGAFLAVFAGVIWREVLAGRNWRNLPVAGLVTVLAAANIAFHLRPDCAGGMDLWIRLGLSAVAILIALIGGRVTPGFTRNWQLKRDGPLPARTGRFDIAVLIMTGAAMAAWTLAPDDQLVGALMAGAGLLNLIRLARWRGWATGREPLVWVLHLGYGWLGAALVLIGLEALGLPIMRSAGVHALTVGAMGVMVLAMMTRATRGHTGRTLAAGWATAGIYLLVNAAALVRVAGGLAPEIHAPAVIASTVLWSAAFAGFVVAYGPMLVLPRPRA